MTAQSTPVITSVLCAVIFSNPACADHLRDGVRAYVAHDYIKAARICTDLAPRGDPTAQTYLGYMYANGKGVPQDVVSAGWYRCASQQGVPRAQYQLGLLYDKAQGVPQDYVTAYALLNLAVAGAVWRFIRWRGTVGWRGAACSSFWVTSESLICTLSGP